LVFAMYLKKKIIPFIYENKLFNISPIPLNNWFDYEKPFSNSLKILK